MDSLTAYILQELAFEGDLGSDVLRLRQIISQYYATHPLASNQLQRVDEQFSAFVWKVLASQDHVVVGVAPEGAAAVYFPPQPGKAKAAGKDKSKANPMSVSLTPLSSDEVTSQPLGALVAKYGNALRIAVEPDICFVCLTGSHIRPSKLSANAYAVLQLITRTRTEGISAAEISRQSGYDPKTCFYLIKILVDFGHIHKIKVGGAAVNICVHKSFYETCKWKLPDNAATADPVTNLAIGAEEEEEEEGEPEDASKEFTTNIQFEPIDNRHMSNITVVKTRIERLLQLMPNGLHVYRHLLEAVGFRSSLKKERRVFTHRVHELFKTRFIEKVWAQSNTSVTGRVLCIRLVDHGMEAGGSVQSSDGEKAIGVTPVIQVEKHEALGTGEALSQFEGVHATQTIAAQIISLVEQSDVTGMTLADIAKCIHDFDPRSITKLTATFSSGQPPTHLSHRALVIVTEMYGRERRQRLFTLAAYRKMIEQEGLEDQSVLSLEGSRTWALFESSDFVADGEERAKWLENFIRRALGRGGKTREKRAKQGLSVNPLDEQGLPIKGRPRVKGTQRKPPRRTISAKRKAQDIEETIQELSIKKRRGEPKAKKSDPCSGSSAVDATPIHSDSVPAPEPRAGAKGEKPVVFKATAVSHQTTAESTSECTLATDYAIMNHTDNSPVVAAGEVVQFSIHGSNAILNDVLTGEGISSAQSGPIRLPNPPLVNEGATPRHSLHPEIPNPSNDSSHPPKRRRLSDGIRVGSLAKLQVEGSVSAPANPVRIDPLLLASPSLDGLTTVQEYTHTHSPDIEHSSDQPPVSSGPRHDRVAQDELAPQYQTHHDTDRQATMDSLHPVSRPSKTTNVSALRRQTEFLQLLENKGGVVNVSLLKAFNEEHQKLLQTLHAAGKTVSTTPGTGMDKRTFNATISALEARGLVKTLVVSALTTHGTTRRANIVYLTNASQESIDECVEEFKAAGSGKSVPLPSNFPEVEDVPYGVAAVTRRASASPLPVPTPLPIDPISAAREAQLSDTQTAAQLVGYKIGHFARARILYLCLLHETFSENPPPSLVSSRERIFSRKYLFEDLPLSSYCAIIPQHSVVPGLKEILETESGVTIRICDVPETVRSALRHRSSVNRSRMHKLLSSLIMLGCLVPANVHYHIETNSTNYVDVLNTEEYWEYVRITTVVPVYHFADKARDAPLSYSHEVLTYDDGVRLWDQLRAASQTSKSRAFEGPPKSPHFEGNPKLLRGIRRKGAWADTYALSASQIDYLYSLVDPATGSTPLDDESSTRFDSACFITAAPAHAVSDFFSRTRGGIQRDLQRVQALTERKARKLKKLTDVARHTLAIKAAQAKRDQDTRWESIVSSALDGRDPSNPQFQKALASLKVEFTVSPQQINQSSWEVRIKHAYKDALGAKQFVIVPPPTPQAAPVVKKPQEELDPSVSRLIVQQGAPVRQKKDVAPKKSGRKSKKELEEATSVEKEDLSFPESEARRRRFPWNADYDELARDAGAIIRVRCRGKRMDWSAIEQVFPGVQRNSVRQRVANLQALPGASEYFRSLDDAWATLWLEHRGSDALPDPNPASATEFDLPAHVSFLRRNVDKAALHAGAKPVKPEVSIYPRVPDTVEEILSQYDIQDNGSVPQPTSWSFFFDIPSEERREREFLQHPFVVFDVDTRSSEVPLSISIAQGAMTISTPEALYNSNDAATTLGLLGDHTIKTAMQNMGETIVRKQAKIGRTYPLRQYTYSDWALYNIKGDFSSAMYADALAMRKQLDIQRGEWRNIDLTDEDGETAVYLELLSENQLDVIIDTTIPATGREQLDDENLEAHIAMRLVASQEDENPGPSNTDIQTMSFLTNVPCLHGSENNVTCAKCLEMAESKISAPDQLAILAALREAKPDGIPIGQIFYGLYNGNATAAAVALTTLTETSPPLVYVAGYSQARIIPAPVLGEWAVKVAQSSGNDDTQFRMVFPRQWVSIHGDVLDDVWASVTQAVAGSFMFRPGISEYGLRKRYRDVFDRLELNDILKYLLVAGKLTRSTRFNVPVGMMDVEMEKNTYWFLTHGGTWF